MGFFKEVWSNQIVENLYADNTFINALKDRSSEVMQGKYINLTVAGTPPDIETGATISYPLTAVERADEVLQFALRAFSTPVIRVTLLVEKQLVPTYRQSVLENSRNNMNDRIAKYLMYQMIVSNSANANIKQDNTSGTGQVSPVVIDTTGDSGQSSLHDASQSRKMMTFNDFRNAAKIMDRQNIPANDRYAIITPDQGYALFGDLMLRYRDPFGMGFGNNEIPKVHGFTVYVRSQAGVFTTAGVARDMSQKNAAIANTDDAVAIFFQKNSVYKAMGSVNPFYLPNDPTYQSDTFSYNQYIGSGRERKDSYGVVLVKEAKIA